MKAVAITKTGVQIKDNNFFVLWHELCHFVGERFCLRLGREATELPVLRTLENVWGLFTATGVQSFKFWFAGLVPAPVNEALAAILSLPAFAVLGVTGVFLAIVFRERDEFA